MKNTDGIISKTINRRISSKISGWIVEKEINISPNEMTVLSFIVSLFAPIFYVIDYAILGGIIAQMSSILDGVDGEIARARGIATKRGAFLDTILDRFSDIAIIMGASVYVFNHTSAEHITFFVCMLALSGCLLVSYLHSAGRSHLGVHPVIAGSIPTIASRDVRIFILFIFSLASQLYVQSVLISLIIIAVLSYAYVVIRTIELLCKHCSQP